MNPIAFRCSSQLAESDPAATASVSAALIEGLGQAQAVHGQALHDRLARLDPEIAAQLQRATSSRNGRG